MPIGTVTKASPDNSPVDTPGTTPDDAPESTVDSRALARVAALAQPVVRTSWRLATASCTAGLCVWLLWLMPQSAAGWVIAISLIALVLLLGPGVILFVFSKMLTDLVAIPDVLLGHASVGGAGVKAIVAESRGGRPHPIKLLRSLYQVGRSGFDAKGTILGAAGFLRLANPVTIAAVLLSAFAGVVLFVIALVGALVRIL